jgi:hypothetical protein
MDRFPPFDIRHIASISQILGNADEGLTARQVETLLRDANIPDVSPANASWQRLFNALVARQNQEGSGNHVTAFLQRAMNPEQYRWAPRTFARRRDLLNPVLAACGMFIAEDGTVGCSLPTADSA